MTLERRKQPRLRLGHLAYIHVEPDSGAIVLDVSDGGIGFHSVAPFHQVRTIFIRFSLHAHKHLQVSSEIAWVDETGKKGGLTFTEISSDVRSQIRTRLLTAPLPSKKASTSALAATNQVMQKAKLNAQKSSSSLPHPLAVPGEIFRRRVITAVSPPKKRKLPGYGGLLAGLVLPIGIAICFLCPYRVQISSGTLFPGIQSTASTKYLELNGFANIATAQSAADMDMLAKGLPVLLVHKDFLGMNFNSILIGPYLIETDLAQVRGTLESEGFSVVPKTWSQVTRPPLLDAVKIR
jgi:hypothetical protein